MPNISLRDGISPEHAAQSFQAPKYAMAAIAVFVFAFAVIVGWTAWIDEKDDARKELATITEL